MRNATTIGRLAGGWLRNDSFKTTWHMTLHNFSTIIGIFTDTSSAKGIPTLTLVHYIQIKNCSEMISVR